MSDRAGSVPAMTSSSAVKAAFRCSECGWRAPKWVGRCGECQAWGSLVEVAAGGTGAATRTAAGPVTAPAVPIGQVSIEESRAQTCGAPELDRVLGPPSPVE